MSNLVPSVVFASQAVELLRELGEAQRSGMTKDMNSLITQLSDLFSKMEDNLGQPLVVYDPVVAGEPPSSYKSNRFWRNAQRDVNLMQQQIDILRAASVFPIIL